MGARVSERIAAITESATLAVDAKAKALKAAGRPIIGFGAGEPDFPTPDYIVEAAVAAARDPRNHHYTPVAGLPELRAAVAGKTRRDTDYDVDAGQVLITNGGKQAVYNTFATLLDPGDEVLLIAPYWTTYPEAIRLAGGVPVEVMTDETSGYLAGVEQLEAARTERTKVLLFVSPSNPTGAVYPGAQVQAIGAWANEHGIWVVTDEIYEHLVYGDSRETGSAGDSREAGSAGDSRETGSAGDSRETGSAGDSRTDGTLGDATMRSIVHSAGEKVVVLNGVAKTYAMTGWRVGWMIGPIDVVKAATNLQSHATSNVNNVAQVAALAAVSGDLSAVAAMRAVYDRRRRTIVALLADIPGVLCPEPMGAFYAYPSVKGLLNVSLRGRTAATSAELAGLILEEAEVAVVPGEAFGTPGYVRMSYALGDDELSEGVDRIAKLVAEG